MHDRAVEQIGDGGEPDMRMRTHVHALAGDVLNGAEMIEEDERPDHLTLAMRQCAPHRKAVTEIAGARHDDEIERVAGFGIAEHGIVGGLPAHEELLEVCGDRSRLSHRVVMPGLVPGIHVFSAAIRQDVGGLVKPGHDAKWKRD
jgi:hypothetical protein